MALRFIEFKFRFIEFESSDSLSLSSDSSESNPDAHAEEIMKTDESKVDEIEVKVEPYPKLKEDKNEELYQGLEYSIFFACHKTLYAKFQSMMSAFGEFVA